MDAVSSTCVYVWNATNSMTGVIYIYIRFYPQCSREKFTPNTSSTYAINIWTYKNKGGSRI